MSSVALWFVMLQMDDCEHSQLSVIVGMLRESVEVADEMKSKLRDTYQNVTDLSASRTTELKKALNVRYRQIRYSVENCRTAYQFTTYMFSMSCSENGSTNTQRCFSCDFLLLLTLMADNSATVLPRPKITIEH